LAIVQIARAHRLELAADYLVMAAWLAYLKSRLLLPADDVGAEEPSGAEMAAALHFQLRRLEAMREAAARLFARPRLGIDVFPRGAPEGIRVNTRSVQADTLFDLLSAYGRTQRPATPQPWIITPSVLFSVSEALQRLRGMLGGSRDWTALMSFLPPDIADDDRVRRSAAAALLGAGLELAKSGAVYLKQDRQFGPIYLRRRQHTAASPTVVGGSEPT
jgi:segregation and condensation protein A